VRARFRLVRQGCPKAPLPRLPGLDGLPKAAVARPGDAAMLGGQTAGNAAPAPITAPIGTPQVDTSKIDAVASKAAEAKAAVEGLNLTATPNVDASSIDAALGKVRELKAEIASLGASLAGVAAQARSIPSPGGAIRGRTSPSFSDGVTPGAGTE
jgi:hypothetical protein